MANWLDGTTTSRTAATLESTITANVGVIPWRRFSTKNFDGTTDITSDLNAALVSLHGAGGGAIQMPVGSGVISAPIIVQDMTGLVGQGSRATFLTLANSSTMTGRGMVENYVSSNGTSDANGQAMVLRDFGLWGNKANNTGGSGIVMAQNPSTGTQASADFLFDPTHHLSNLFITQCKEHGIYASGRSGTTYSGIQSYANNGYGIRPSFDSALVNCHVGGAGLAGFYLDVPQVYLSSCKAFSSGAVTTASGHGFHLVTGGGSCSLASCASQDNRAAGFFIAGCNNNTLVGCVADSNSRVVTGDYCGFQIEGVSAGNYILGGVAQQRSNGYTGVQSNAVYVGNSATGNVIEVVNRNAGVAVGPAIAPTTNTNGNKFIIDRQGGGWQAPSFAATFTPDQYAGSDVYISLTGNITTLNVPANPYNGQRLRFFFKQDATGGRTVSFASGYKLSGGTWSPTTTASKVNIIEFEYSETLGFWLETTRSTDLN